MRRPDLVHGRDVDETNKLKDIAPLARGDRDRTHSVRTRGSRRLRLPRRAVEVRGRAEAITDLSQ